MTGLRSAWQLCVRAHVFLLHGQTALFEAIAVRTHLADPHKFKGPFEGCDLALGLRIELCWSKYTGLRYLRMMSSNVTAAIESHKVCVCVRL